MNSEFITPIAIGAGQTLCKQLQAPNYHNLSIPRILAATAMRAIQKGAPHAPVFVNPQGFWPPRDSIRKTGCTQGSDSMMGPFHRPLCQMSEWYVPWSQRRTTKTSSLMTFALVTHDGPSGPLDSRIMTKMYRR